MPCSDGEPTSLEQAKWMLRNQAGTNAQPDYRQEEFYKQRCNHLAQMLCRCCKHLEVKDPAFILHDRDIISWWAEHREFDKQEGR